MAFARRAHGRSGVASTRLSPAGRTDVAGGADRAAIEPPVSAPRAHRPEGGRIARCKLPSRQTPRAAVVQRVLQLIRTNEMDFDPTETFS